MNKSIIYLTKLICLYCSIENMFDLYFFISKEIKIVMSNYSYTSYFKSFL